MKSVFVSVMEKEAPTAQPVMAQLQRYGLSPKGLLWNNDNAKMGWLAPIDHLLVAEVAIWAILASRQDLENPELRYGLSLLSLVVAARRSGPLSLVILQTDTAAIDRDTLPTPLRSAVILPATDAGTPAKLVAKIHAKLIQSPSAYHLDMVGSEQFGQWLELRPAGDPWPGVIFGVDEGEIRFQAVGPAGKLPDKTVLNYAMQGLKLSLGDTEFTAWATRNEIGSDTAYFVKIDGFPTTLIFGPYAEQEETDMHVIHLK